jgi:hypothetical protein
MFSARRSAAGGPCGADAPTAHAPAAQLGAPGAATSAGKSPRQVTRSPARGQAHMRICVPASSPACWPKGPRLHAPKGPVARIKKAR